MNEYEVEVKFNVRPVTREFNRDSVATQSESRVVSEGLPALIRALMEQIPTELHDALERHFSG